MEFERKKEGYGHLIKWVIGLGDVIVINLSFALMYKLFITSGDTIRLLSEGKTGTAFLLINLIYFVTLSIIPTKTSSNIIFFDKIIQRSLSFTSLYFILFSVGYTLFQLGEFKWSAWILFYIGLCFSYLLWHIVLRSIIKAYRSRGYNYKRTIIIGNAKSVLNVYYEIRSGDYGYKVLGFFGEKGGIDIDNIPYLGTLSEVERFCLENNVDEIFCTLPNNEESDILQLINFAEKNMIRFFLVPEFYGYIRRKLVLNFLQSIPVITIRPEPLQRFYNRIIKRCFDIIFSLFVLATIFPIVFIIFSILIKVTSRGPIFFKQQRTGLQGKPFTCYKFRSMNLNEDSDDKIATENDIRITRVGAFMRRTSIDELPQFFNVLMGNMSVVGPRPHMIKQTDLYNKLIDKFMIRHIVKPGITGWAQISGYRGETKTIEQMEGRFNRDVWYIENWSFILDVKIIVVTIYLIIKGDDKAY